MVGVALLLAFLIMAWAIGKYEGRRIDEEEARKKEAEENNATETTDEAGKE